MIKTVRVLRHPYGVWVTREVAKTFKMMLKRPDPKGFTTTVFRWLAIKTLRVLVTTVFGLAIKTVRVLVTTVFGLAIKTVRVF